MMSLMGELSLFFALMFSVIQSVLPLVGYYKNNPYLLAFARPGAIGQFGLVLAAYVIITIAFVTNDFSIAYVAANSHPTLPLMYQLTAVWGAHEGSILLWILLLSTWTVAYALIRRNDPAQPVVLAVLGCISLSFLCFLLFTSNPFSPATQHLSGSDLNPLLQDPGFIIHPPMLYTGYVGFSVAFAITLGALIRGQLNRDWASTARQFALVAWSFLTLGIALGSWWAYRVLGWGGFWFWDPVENASLLPWLAGTALIHVLVLAEKRDAGKRWAVLLSIICFALSLLGTFLVRSGVLVSAHTFATDPSRGIFLLLLLAILITLALAIYIIRIPQLSFSKLTFSPLSREMALLINTALLMVAMLTVLLGTIYPLILDALHLGVISVGAPYFNIAMAPIILITMACMGYAAFCHWQTQSAKALWQQTWIKLSLSFLVAIILMWSFTHQLSVLTTLSLAMSIWIILSVYAFFKIKPAMSFAHLGFAVLIIGVMFSTLLNQEREVRIKPGDSVNVGPYHFVFLDAKGIAGSNYRGIQGSFSVYKQSRHVADLYPEKRIYLVRDMVMTKVDIHPGIFRDLYIALGQPFENDDWSVRIYYKPFVRWIWAGALIMLLGGILGVRRSR